MDRVVDFLLCETVQKDGNDEAGEDEATRRDERRGEWEMNMAIVNDGS